MPFENNELCDVTVIHHDIVHNVKKNIEDIENLFELAELFKMFGDSTRIRILSALSISEMCVCDLAALLEMTSPAISHQLKNLKSARLIKSRRAGKVVYYSLADEHVKQIIKQGLDHIING